jgi:phosphoserine phosphatase
MMSAEKTLLMVTISGKDRPGIAASFSRILMQHNVELVDIEQASLQDLLGLYMLLDLEQTTHSSDNVIKDLLFEASRQGLILNFGLYSPEEVNALKERNLYVLTHFGGNPALASIAKILNEEKVNIEMISSFDHKGDLAMELTINMKGIYASQVKKRLLLISRENGFDMAMQSMETYRKNKRLVFFDMDSTLIQQEVIDELARRHGVHREVSRITEKAMRGDFDFEESLIQRVAMLKGLPVSQMHALCDEFQLSPGVEHVIKTLKWMGYKLAVVSGGFQFFANHLKERLGLDYAFANKLRITNDKASGKLDGEIVDDAAKARIVSHVACEESILMDQVVCVGDGANDVLMLGQAGLGIAYNAKRRLDEVADVALGAPGMAHILHLLGITDKDIEEANQDQGC